MIPVLILSCDLYLCLVGVVCLGLFVSGGFVLNLVVYVCCLDFVGG